MMKEENKDLYRIDPLKVRRKIFELYPVGSKQREDMVKEEKLKELGHLNNVVSGFSNDLTLGMLEEYKQINTMLIIKSGFFTAVAGILCIFLFSLDLSIVETFFSTVGAVIFGYLSLTSLLRVYLNSRVIKEFTNKLKEAEEKISKLKKDIFNDLS